MLRLGLCCLFRREPIRFRAATAKFLGRFERPEQLARLSALCLENARSLRAAVATAARLGIGAFRVSSPLLPLYTHPKVGYRIEDLPDAGMILSSLEETKVLAAELAIRLSFHPDQFTLLSSPRPEVISVSIVELDYQAMLAERIGADAITIHGGGGYGDKKSALARLSESFGKLSEPVRSRLCLENDDKTYGVADLLPLCDRLKIPFVYDVHHHRCNGDGLSVREATEESLRSWERVGREPWFHVSSPKNGWEGHSRPHADFIDPADFPGEWRGLSATVDVEAKAKEEAVEKLRVDLGIQRWEGRKGGAA